MFPIQRAMSFALLMSLSSVAFADFVSASVAEPSSMTPAQAVDRLTAVLQPKLFRLEREMVTFHYDQANPKFQPNTLWDIQWRIVGRTERFFDSSIRDGMMLGPGTYVAVDPAGTRSYGGDKDPQLFVIPLKAGGVVLNGKSDVSESELASIGEVLSSQGCGSKTDLSRMGMSSDAIVTHFRNNEKENCRQLIIGAFRKLGIQAVLYPYQAATSLGDCRTGRQDALNVVSRGIINEPRMSYYSDTKAIEGAPMAGPIARLYQEAVRDYYLQMSSEFDNDRQMPASLQAGTIPYPFYRAWKKNKVYRCGRPQNFETADPFDQFMEKLRETFVDLESQRLLIRLHTDFMKRFPTLRYSFNILRLRGVEQSAYRLSGLASDDSKLDQWRTAVDAADGSGDDDAIAKKVASLLEEQESVSMMEMSLRVRKLLTSVSLVKGPQPGFLLDIFMKAGLGQRRAQIFVNQMVSQFGGVPFLVGRFAKDPKNADRELLVQNRDYFRSMLRSCIAQYEDVSISNEQIEQGSCGLRPSPRN